jgi:hypothetical protein
MMISTARLRAACLSLLLLLPGSLSAQIRASERGSVSQTIDGTVITIDYSRPQVRGRDSLFGGVEHWGAVWTPGANFATTLETNRPIKLDGHPVPPGKYSLWLVLQPDEWTMVIDPRPRMYHVPYPYLTADQIRYPVKPGTGPFNEMLTFTFEEVRGDRGMLYLRWGTTQVAFRVEVEPKLPLTVDEATARPLLGTYRFRWEGAPAKARGSRVTLAYENGMLMGRWSPAPFPDVATFQLVRITDDWYLVGSVMNGELVDVMDEWAFEFAREDGQAVKFELWSDNDHLDGTGVRE